MSALGTYQPHPVQPAPRLAGVTRRQISPIWLVLVGIASVQLGAAVAKHLFDEIEPTAMVWLRLVTSSIVLLASARPQLRGRSRDDWLTVVAFGVTLGAMNWSIYQAFARIPLGLAVTFEFAGPLVLAVVMSRRARDLVWVALAARGRRAARVREDRPRPRRASPSRWPRAPRGRRTSCSAPGPAGAGRASTGSRWPAWSPR